MPSFASLSTEIPNTCMHLSGQTQKTMTHQQYTWMVLLQGFRDDPHLFVRALEKDLRELQL